MKLSILVPHYTEPIEVVKPLLDSIAIQQNIDFQQVEVIVANDDDHLLDFEKYNYPFTIKNLKCGKVGVSEARNIAFRNSVGEYVTWCDCDDMYASATALWFVFNEMKAPNQDGTIGFNALYSAFLEESRTPDASRQPFYIVRTDGFQFVHGKFFRRQFLVDNDIAFEPDCYIHEDSVLNNKVSAVTQNIKWNPNPFYLWKWVDSSVCRRDPKYILKTYVDLIKSVTRCCEWYIKHGYEQKVIETATFMILDGYYSMCCKEWVDINNEEYRHKTEEKFKQFYHTYKYYWEKSDNQYKMAVSNGIRQRCVSEGRMLQETIILSDWLCQFES